MRATHITCFQLQWKVMRTLCAIMFSAFGENLFLLSPQIKMPIEESNVNATPIKAEQEQSTKQPIYILNVHPMLIDDSLVWDMFYLTKDSTELHCLRIFNIELSFMVARLPGLRLDQFKRFMEEYTGDLHTEIRTDLADASFYSFGVNHEYMEIFSQSPFVLSKVYKAIWKDCEFVYRNINPNKLPAYDQLFYRNTETPFRYTSTTLSFPNSTYNLSTKYNIPLVGGATLDTSRLTNSFPQQHLPEDILSANIVGLNAQLPTNELEERDRQIAAAKSEESILTARLTNITLPAPSHDSYNSGKKTKWNYATVNQNIPFSIKRDDTVDFKCNITMLSYDIETYNEDGNLDPTIKNNYIFCIGIGMFNLVDQKPWKRLCILSKPFDTLTPKSLDKERVLKAKRSKRYHCPVFTFDAEYNPADQLDSTDYIIARDEKELLEVFISVIRDYKPQIINGFNSFAFDDNYVWQRMKMHGLSEEYLRCFTYYNTDELKNEFWFKSFAPAFKQFELKIDGEQRQDNASVRSPLVLTVDVRKLMLKEDPKRFTAYGRGNLDTMLDTYQVKNPFTNAPLSKTGLKIHEMYDRWINNYDIYSVAIYCCQDAWICGTLLVKRAKIADLIELANISNTTFNDSIYRADGNRVANAILGYAYKENFALMDTPFEKRKEAKHDKSIVQYGGKQFDHRTVMGGAVRCAHAGRHVFIIALDYSAAYPANKEGNNVDSSSRVDADIINNPAKYGLEIVAHKIVNEPTDEKDIYYIRIIDPTKLPK